MIRVQKAKDFPQGHLPVMILEYLDIDPGWIIFAEMCGELNNAMRGVIMAYESADEPDHDDRRQRGRADRRDDGAHARLPQDQRSRKKNESGKMREASVKRRESRT